MFAVKTHLIYTAQIENARIEKGNESGLIVCGTKSFDSPLAIIQVQEPFGMKTDRKG